MSVKNKALFFSCSVKKSYESIKIQYSLDVQVLLSYMKPSPLKTLMISS
jgi:hypothetical protein